MSTLAQVAAAQAAFAAREVTRPPADPLNRLNRGEMRLLHRSSLVHSHRNPAALCAPLAPPCWAVFWAQCSSRDWRMRVLAALAGLAAVASDLLRSFCS